MGHKEKILFPVLIFLASVLTPAASAPGKTILDYYNKIPVKLLNGERYTLQQKEGKWITQSGAGYDFEAVVDIKNGYMNIMDDGTGGGSITHELALYRTKAGSDLIGVNLITTGGIAPECTLQFYDPSGDAWKNVTGDLLKEVLPKLNLSMFLDEDLKMPMEEIRRVHGIAFIYALPRIGTTMRVGINVDGYMINGNKSAESKEIVEGIKYKEIKLIWDMKKGRFTIGEKIPFPLSERINNL